MHKRPKQCPLFELCGGANSFLGYLMPISDQQVTSDGDMVAAKGSALSRTLRAPVPGQVTENDFNPRSAGFVVGRRIRECNSRKEPSGISCSMRNSAPSVAPPNTY